jgi:hypothetical protein
MDGSTWTETERSYRVLELDETATPRDVERSWRKLTREWDPERFLDDPILHGRAESRIRCLNEARESLRAHFDSGAFVAVARPSRVAETLKIRNWRTMPVGASTLIGGCALAVLVMARPSVGLKTQAASLPGPAVAFAKPAPRPAASAASSSPQMLLVAHAPVTVTVSLVADGRILLPPTELHPGETTSVPRLGPSYVKYSAGENLEVEINGRRYAMPDAGPSRAKIN